MIDQATDTVPLLEVSDERDLWFRRVLAAERAGYARGFNAGRARACVWHAETEQRRESLQWWNDWWSKVARIITSCDHPDQRRRQLEAEIAADQKFMAEAAHLLFTKPGKLSPLQSAVVHRWRGERLDPNMPREAA